MLRKRRIKHRDYRSDSSVQPQPRRHNWPLWYAQLHHPPARTHTNSQAQVDISDYGLVSVINVVRFFLIVSLETPYPSHSPTQSLGSTQTMLQPHSTITAVCDDSTSSVSTHTAPTSMKLLDYVPRPTVSTYSNRMRRSQATCPPITVITPMPSSTTLPLPILYSWGEVPT